MKSPYSSSANKDVLVAILQINNYLMCLVLYWLIFCFVYSLLLAPVLKIRSQYQPVLHSSSKPLGHELQKRWGLRKFKSDCLWLDGYGLDLNGPFCKLSVHPWGDSFLWRFPVSGGKTYVWGFHDFVSWLQPTQRWYLPDLLSTKAKLSVIKNVFGPSHFNSNKIKVGTTWRRTKHSH